VVGQVNGEISISTRRFWARPDLSVLGLIEHPAVSKAMQASSVMIIENPDLISPSPKWLLDKMGLVPLFF